MINKDILWAAMQQSANDQGCKAEDFLKTENVVVPFTLGAKAKKYYSLPIACNFISYGNNVVAAASGECFDLVEEYVKRYQYYHCFETPNMKWLNDRLERSGQTICFMAEYFLPDMDRLQRLQCDYELRLLEAEDFENLYLPEWSNALCSDRKQLDVLGVGAFDGLKLVGFAGCSADAEGMWQIGVDVLPEYRQKGIAASVTSNLAAEIFDRGKIPFYCAAWSNIRSVKNAIKSGFSPAWVEMTAKPIEKVNEMNNVGK